VTFTGTIYGAGLKTQQEWKAVSKHPFSSPPFTQRTHGPSSSLDMYIHFDGIVCLHGVQEKQKVQEASADEKIALLSQHRADLMRQKWEIEGKLAELRARMKGNAEAGESGGAGDGPR
jgi:hypothetical protein